MQFHDYMTMKPRKHRGTTEDFIRTMMTMPDDGSPQSAQNTTRGAIELGWLTRSRPFYNVYPIAVDLCQKTSLNMKWGDILLPTRYISLRFAAGHEPFGISCALLRVPSAGKESTPVQLHHTRMPVAHAMPGIPICGVIQSKSEPLEWLWLYVQKDIKEEVVGDSTMSSDTWAGGPPERVAANEQVDFLIRLLAFIGLLARGTDLITPAILSKDRAEYDATSDESRKRWLEQRAKNRLGEGFDIGRSMEIERATSPHWRQPHLALFHTGPGRTVPVLKVRSGCVVVPKDMSSVPTGYLGEEQPGEAPNDLNTVNSTKIPYGLRMRIFNRDGRRCRCCGKTAEDGVTLEVDHINPRANGGGNEEWNLWVLCKPCNNGKSDRLLKSITPSAIEREDISNV